MRVKSEISHKSDVYSTYTYIFDSEFKERRTVQNISRRIVLALQMQMNLFT